MLARNGKAALSRKTWGDTLSVEIAGAVRPAREVARQGVASRGSQQLALFPFRASGGLFTVTSLEGGGDSGPNPTRRSTTRCARLKHSGFSTRAPPVHR